MFCTKTKNGRYLVKVSDTYGCYTQEDGTFIRSVDNITEEWVFAQSWESFKEEQFPHEEVLLKALQYVSDYTATVETED